MIDNDELWDDEEDTSADRLDILSKNHAPESRAADIVAEKRLIGRYRYAPELGWLEWNGVRWDDNIVIEDRVTEVIRRFIDKTERDCRAQHAELAEQVKVVRAEVMRRVPTDARKDEKGKAVSESALFTQYATEDEKAKADKLDAERAHVGQQGDVWLNLLSGGKIRSLARLCRGQEGILTRADAFDAHPDLLNVGNGVVDLRTGEVMAHDRDLLLTKLAGGDYVPGATHPLWTKTLAAIHPDIEKWAQTRMGQSITGHTPDDDALVIAAGGGENGKSALMVAIMRAAGTYGRLISHRVLLVQPGQHPTELMDLRGLRIALMEETPEEGRLDTHQLKTTVGTPQITARRMRKDPITFDCSHSLWVNTNYLPQVDTTDHGTWRRLKAMPFPYKFVKPGRTPDAGENEREGDPNLKPMLATAEGLPEAVIAWLVEGARRWYAANRVAPSDPKLVVEATDRWRQSSDVGFQFALERLVTDEKYYITAETMRAEFTEFLRAQGKPEWSAKTINARLGPSMRAAGVMVQSDPTTATKVRIGDSESAALSTPTRAEARAGSKVRMWRGVRFKTTAERLVGDEAGAERLLTAVPDVT